MIPESTLPADDTGLDPTVADSPEVRSAMLRETPEPEPARAELVNSWSGRITRAKEHWKSDFDRMREDQQFVRGAQWEGAEEEDLYTANIVQRHVNQRVAALYAKNPTVVVHRRQTLDFTQWDGSMSALQSVQMAVDVSMQTGMPLPPQVQSLIADISQGITRRQMLEKVASTLTIIYDYTLSEQLPPFKVQMKQLVRRVCTTGVGYVKLGYQRVYRRDPEDVERVNGLSEQISRMERMLSDKVDGETDEGEAQVEELRLMLADMQTREQQIAREGLVFDFPSSTSIIIDPACRHLRTFLGARWIAEEHYLTADDIKEIYGVDLASHSNVTRYDDEKTAGTAGLRQAIKQGASGGDNGEKKRDLTGRVCVWTIWDKANGQTLTIANGYPDFLVEPQQPTVFLERFWPIFPLTFNEAEDEDGIYPRSDVHLLKPMQKEYNRSREGLRQHRIANRPKIAVAGGKLDDDDIAKLQSHPPNAVLQLNGLAPNEDIKKLLQPIAGAPIDPALYDTSAIYEDLLRVVGQSDASIGMAAAGVTATGDSIAEQNRTVSIASNVDDLDDMLNELSRSAGQVLLMEMDPQTAAAIAGPGSVWPELSRDEVAKELMLEIEAGSSGRPNRAAEVANFERLAPLLLQIPGVNPEWMIKQLIQRMDDRLDPVDAIAAGLPSIVAQNAMTKAAQSMGAGGAPGGQPEDQGGEGGQNAEAPPSGPPGGAPSALPQPGPGGAMPGAGPM